MFTSQKCRWLNKDRALTCFLSKNKFPALNPGDEFDLSFTLSPDLDEPTLDTNGNAISKYTKQDFQQILQAILGIKKCPKTRSPQKSF